MILNNLRFPDRDGTFHISIGGSKISSVSAGPIAGSRGIDFEAALVFPGLINSHDHLDFNLFPMLGDKIYPDYTAWGEHIHKQYKKEIGAVLAIPTALRVKWGIYKNLLCGVTTVVNHGEKFEINNPPITIFQDCQNLHSVKFEKKWRARLNNPFTRKCPVVIHSGEGTDAASHNEVNRLLEWNLLKRELVAVHGVAMGTAQAARFKALVWCPYSNYFMLNTTAPVNELKHCTSILFGTDSTLTGDWNIWEHLRLARKSEQLSDVELYRSLGQNASGIWGLNAGQISAGKDADLVIARNSANITGWESFYSLGPGDLLLVISKGKVRLFDSSLMGMLSPHVQITRFHAVEVGGTDKYVEGDLPKLMHEIKSYCPAAAFPVLSNALQFQ